MTRDEFIKMFPEVEEVQDETLREQCIEVWLDAIEIGGWDEKGLENIPMAVNMDRQDLPSKGFVHLRKTVQTSVVLARRVIPWLQKYKNVNPDYVIAGAVLHDVGKLLEIDLNTAGMPMYSAKYGVFKHTMGGAYLCKKHGLPDKVVQAVANHSTMINALNDKVLYPEAPLVKGADLFAARMFSTGGPDMGNDMILI